MLKARNRFKLDLAVAIAVVTGCMFLWGWVYWMFYFVFYGLPPSFVAGMGIQRLIAAGSAFIVDFVLYLAIAILIAIPIYNFLKLLFIKFFLQIVPNRFRVFAQNFRKWALRSQQARWMFGSAICVALYQGYWWSLDYVRNNAHENAAKRPDRPWTAVKITLNDKRVLPESATEQVDLLDYRNGWYYFLRTRNGTKKVTEVLILPDNQVAKIELQGLLGTTAKP